MERCNVDTVIEAILSEGSRTPDELSQSVMKKVSVSERTYYRRLEMLLKRHVVEEVAEKGGNGRIIRKYTLKSSAASSLLLEPASVGECALPSRRYLEIAAWLRREPDGWPVFEAIRKAKLLERDYAYLIPAIEVSCEDPDRYAFVWSDEPCYGRRHGEFVQSRFFRLKDVYQTLAEFSDAAGGCERVVVGVYGSAVVAEQVTLYENMDVQIQREWRPVELRVAEEPFSVCVALCKRADGVLRVVYVEGRGGQLDKAWVKGVSRQLGAKADKALSYGSLKEDVKRAVLLKLRSALEKHLLVVPIRYVKLVEELLDYSYKNPSTGYVIALALAVDLALP
jgi:hypothetical protein